MTDILEELNLNGNHVSPEELSAVLDYILAEKRQHLPRWRADDDEKARFRAVVEEALVNRRVNLRGRPERVVAEEIAGMLTGIGVLTPLIGDDDNGIEEIIVRQSPDGTAHVQVERNGVIYDLGALAPMDHFRQILDRAADEGGAVVKADSPLAIVDLPSGDRLTAIIPPLSKNGVAINIRRFARKPISLDEMAQRGALPQSVADYLALVTRDNLASALICGASGSGKTTLLNAMSLHISPRRQLAVAETFRELRLAHPYPLRAAAPAELSPREEEAGLLTLRDVVNTLYTRMRPDLILLGEVVGAEAVEFLRAINLGSRAMTTIHGSSSLGGLMALEMLAVQYGGLDRHVAREWIARGIELVVHLDRAANGMRYVSEVALLKGLDDRGNYRLASLFTHEEARESRLQKLEREWRTMNDDSTFIIS